LTASEDIVTRTFESESFELLLDDLTREIEFRNYRVTRIYDIDNIFEQPERGIDATITFERYKIVEFCNLGSCAELISQDLRAGVFMPVRFVVYRKAGASDVSISFLKPSAFARQFDSPPLAEMAALLEGDMTEVLDELAF
jgi:uncharacterized protein (DUF302 family)